MVDFYESATTPACHQALDYLRHHFFIEDFYSPQFLADRGSGFGLFRGRRATAYAQAAAAGGVGGRTRLL